MRDHFRLTEAEVGVVRTDDPFEQPVRLTRFRDRSRPYEVDDLLSEPDLHNHPAGGSFGKNLAETVRFGKVRDIGHEHCGTPPDRGDCLQPENRIRFLNACRTWTSKLEPAAPHSKGARLADRRGTATAAARTAESRARSPRSRNLDRLSVRHRDLLSSLMRV